MSNMSLVVKNSECGGLWACIANVIRNLSFFVHCVYEALSQNGKYDDAINYNLLKPKGFGNFEDISDY